MLKIFKKNELASIYSELKSITSRIDALESKLLVKPNEKRVSTLGIPKEIMKEIEKIERGSAK